MSPTLAANVLRAGALCAHWTCCGWPFPHHEMITAESNTQVLHYLKSLFTPENLPGIILYDNMCNFLRTVQTVQRQLQKRDVNDPLIDKFLSSDTLKKGERALTGSRRHVSRTRCLHCMLTLGIDYQ